MKRSLYAAFSRSLTLKLIAVATLSCFSVSNSSVAALISYSLPIPFASTRIDGVLTNGTSQETNFTATANSANLLTNQFIDGIIFTQTISLDTFNVTLPAIGAALPSDGPFSASAGQNFSMGLTGGALAIFQQSGGNISGYLAAFFTGGGPASLISVQPALPVHYFLNCIGDGVVGINGSCASAPTTSLSTWDFDKGGTQTFTLAFDDRGGTTGNLLTTTPAPEPATLAIFGLGLAGLGLMRRRRRV